MLFRSIFSPSFIIATLYLCIFFIYCVFAVLGKVVTWRDIFRMSISSRQLFLYTLLAFIPVLYVSFNQVEHHYLFSALIWVLGLVAVLYGSRITAFAVITIVFLALIGYLVGNTQVAEFASQLFFYGSLVLITSWFL